MASFDFFLQLTKESINVGLVDFLDPDLVQDLEQEVVWNVRDLLNQILVKLQSIKDNLIESFPNDTSLGDFLHELLQVVVLVDESVYVVIGIIQTEQVLNPFQF